MNYVYVMSRTDGWHKVGVSVDPEARALLVKYDVPRTVWPVVLLRAYRVEGHPAERIERKAHAILEKLGAQRDREWFNAPSRKCVAAIKEAFSECFADPRIWRRAECEAERNSDDGPRFEIIRDGKTMRKFARRRWLSKKWHMTDEDAVAHLTNWTVDDALREFGPSGRN